VETRNHIKNGAKPKSQKSREKFPYNYITMKKLVLLTGFLMFLLTTAFSQPENGAITFQKKKYYQNGHTLTSAQVNTLLAGNPASAPEYKKAKANMNVVAPIIIGGTVCLLAGSAITLASSMKQAKDVNDGKLSGAYPSGLGLVLLGLTIDLASIPFVIPASRHFKKSMDLYNSSVNKTGYRPLQFNLMFTSTGLGVRMNF
jgi:hypothetical protein